MAFEARFREFAPRSIEAWYEVIFWKLASTGKRGEYFAGRFIEKFRASGYTAPELWKACSDFVESGGRKEFRALQDRLFLTSAALPVAATFPAFMYPERFPMADRWVAKWVSRYCDENPAQARDLVKPSEAFLQGKKTTLTVPADWQFYLKWVEWCRTSAKHLAELTAFPWRARDVEMAVFTNARSGAEMLPLIGEIRGGRGSGRNLGSSLLVVVRRFLLKRRGGRVPGSRRRGGAACPI
ncbi:MAG: hypothetical protein ACLQU2_01535 [Candidatus Binataceae bacterium]